MSLVNLYSKRQKTMRGEISDIYEYNIIPSKLKIQIIHILNDTVGLGHTYETLRADPKKHNYADKFYEKIRKILLHEYGKYKLTKEPKGYRLEVQGFLTGLNTECYYDDEDFEDLEYALDVIELCFSEINTGYSKININTNEKAEKAISELNHRFKEAGVGYQFEGNEMIRVDSQIMHSNVIKPVIQLLHSNKYFEGANDEYLSAHEHYRHKRYKECLTDCCKSFESMLKAIHEMNEWEYKKTDSASRLIISCFEKELIPSYIQSQFTSLQGMLGSGVPTIRNNKSGHGQGVEIKEVNEELVSYMLHLTATNLLFLADSQKKYQKNN